MAERWVIVPPLCVTLVRPFLYIKYTHLMNLLYVVIHIVYLSEGSLHKHVDTLAVLILSSCHPIAL